MGFLGAGVILHQGRQVKGLTTAATIWLAAALGIGAGSGYLLFTLVTALLALFVLWVLPVVETKLEASRLTRVYHVSCIIKPGKGAELVELFRKHRLRIRSQSQAKRGDTLLVTIKAAGRPENHEKVAEALIGDWRGERV